MEHRCNKNRALRIAAVAALAVAAGTVGRPLRAQPFVAQSRSDAMPEISGTWRGDGWGDVTLRPDGTGTYTDTYGSVPGRLQIRRTGARTYAGSWGEVIDRHGVLVFVIEADGRTLRGAWTPDPGCSVGTSTGASLIWTRR